MREPWMDEQDRQDKMEKHDKMLPHCEDCGCVIHDFGYKIERKFGGAEWYCEECMRKEHYQEVQNYGE